MAKISKDEKNKNKIALLEYKVKGGKIILKKTKLGYMYYIRVYKPREYNYASEDIPTDIYEGKENGKVAQLKEKLLIEIEKLNKRLNEVKLVEIDSINEYKSKKFITYLREYIDSKKKLRPITKTTYHHYIDTMERFLLLKKWQNLTLKDLSTFHIDEFYKYLRTERNLKVVTLRKYSNIIKPAIEKAYIKNYIPTNIYYAVEKFESCPEEDEEGDAFSKEEFERFLEISNNHPLENVFKLTYLLGLRRSEVLGLRWSNIDFENDTIKILGNVQKIKKNFIIEETKNKTTKSTHTYATTTKLKSLLMLIKDNTEQNKKMFGNAYNYEYEDFVCVDALGNLFNPGYLTSSFRKIVDKLQIEDKNLHFHSIRHTAGTLLYQATKDILMTMKFLRHTNLKTTQRYVHADENDKTESVEQVSSAVDF